MSAAVAPVPVVVPRVRPTRSLREGETFGGKTRHLELAPTPKASVVVRVVVPALVLLAASVLGAVSLGALAAGEAVAARSLESEVSAALRLEQQLTAEVAELSSPERIAAWATANGMVQSGPAIRLDAPGLFDDARVPAWAVASE